MSRLITTINAIAFPWEVDTLAIGTTASGERSVSVDLLCGEVSILSTALSFGGDGTVTLEDMASLFEAYSDDAVKNCVLKLNGVTAASWVLIPCRLSTTDSAQVWCSQSFLTVVRGERMTHAASREYLSWWQPSAGNATLSVAAVWASSSGVQTESRTMSVDARQGINTHSWNVSEWTPPAAGAVLVRYTISLGNRIQRYCLRAVEHAPSVLCFLNSFGVYESMTFFGVVERDTKPTRTSAIIGGKTRNYDVESVPTWKASTGELPEGMSGLMDDVVRARRLWLMDGAIGDVEVTLTDNEWKRTNTSVDSLSGTVTWRMTSRRQLRARTAQDGRIFDETFDETFN